MEDMYKVMNRIQDLKKRFHSFNSMRHNKTGNKTAGPKKNYEMMQNSEIHKPGTRTRITKNPALDVKKIDAYKGLIEKYSDRNNIPSSLVKAMIESESGYNPGAVTEKGGKGLMGLLPEVIQSLGVADPFDPADNISAGTRHLRDLLSAYNGDYKRALTAYSGGNRGQGENAGNAGRKDTAEYVNRVIQAYMKNR